MNTHRLKTPSRPAHRGLLWGLSLAFLISACGAPQAETAEAAQSDAPVAFDAEAEVAKWVDLWATYDLNKLDDLFLQDERLTYFSSEYEGMMSGGVALREHHESFGFVEGGLEPEQELWVEDIRTTDLGGAHMIAAIWYFGDRANRDEAGHGPMTVIYLPDADGYKISHMHFANY